MNFSFTKIFFLFLSISVIAVSCSEDDTLDPATGSNDGNGSGGGTSTVVTGCMDTTACNYNEAATEDDGSCDFSCIGCTDSTACNYNEAATEDDGSCDFSCLGCTDATAFNYDEGATIDDGSCEDASEIIQNTWILESDCDGFLADFVVPGEVTIEAGENPGDLIINLAAGFSLEGSIDSNGIIVVPGQDPIIGVTVSGAGSLIDNENASVYLTISTLLGSENCTITFTL